MVDHSNSDGCASVKCWLSGKAVQPGISFQDAKNKTIRELSEVELSTKAENKVSGKENGDRWTEPILLAAIAFEHDLQIETETWVSELRDTPHNLKQLRHLKNSINKLYIQFFKIKTKERNNYIQRLKELHIKRLKLKESKYIGLTRSLIIKISGENMLNVNNKYIKFPSKGEIIFVDFRFDRKQNQLFINASFNGEKIILLAKCFKRI